MASLTAPRRTTELDAINTMLTNIREAPITVIIPTSKASALKAQQFLAKESIEVQSKGYNFCTSRNVKLTPNSGGEVILPVNALSFHPVSYSQNMILQEEDGKLFDAERQSFVFGDPVYVEMVQAKAFETLPEPARHFITLSATLKFAAAETSGSTLQITARDVEEAKRALDAYDRRLRKGGLRAHNPHFIRLRGNR